MEEALKNGAKPYNPISITREETNPGKKKRMFIALFKLLIIFFYFVLFFFLQRQQ